MSKSEYDRAWGTAGWLDDHELAGDGAIRVCQRKTKAYQIAESAVRRIKGVNVHKVYRKVFGPDRAELCAAFLWGTADVRDRNQAPTLMLLVHVIKGFLYDGCAVDAHVTTFLYDVPSGGWKALVVFTR